MPYTVKHCKRPASYCVSNGVTSVWYHYDETNFESRRAAYRDALAEADALNVAIYAKRFSLEQAQVQAHEAYVFNREEDRNFWLRVVAAIQGSDDDNQPPPAAPAAVRPIRPLPTSDLIAA
jgi:hypothetical protein